MGIIDEVVIKDPKVDVCVFMLAEYGGVCNLRENVNYKKSCCVECSDFNSASDWWTKHLPTCGTAYRGCDPDCPKEKTEQRLQSGTLIDEAFVKDIITRLHTIQTNLFTEYQALIVTRKLLVKIIGDEASQIRNYLFGLKEDRHRLYAEVTEKLRFINDADLNTVINMVNWESLLKKYKEWS